MLIIWRIDSKINHKKSIKYSCWFRVRKRQIFYIFYVYRKKNLFMSCPLMSSSSTWMDVYVCMPVCWHSGPAEHHRPSTTFLSFLFPRVYTGHEVRGWNHRQAQVSFGFGQSDRQIRYRMPLPMTVSNSVKQEWTECFHGSGNSRDKFPHSGICPRSHQYLQSTKQKALRNVEIASRFLRYFINLNYLQKNLIIIGKKWPRRWLADYNVNR